MADQLAPCLDLRFDCLPNSKPSQGAGNAGAEAVALDLQAGQVDEAASSGVRGYDEDVVVARRQTAAAAAAGRSMAALGRLGVCSVRGRRGRWGVHGGECPRGLAKML